MLISSAFQFNDEDDNYDRIEMHSLRFFTVSSLPRELSHTCTLKWPGRNRVQITCKHRAVITCNMSCASWYEGAARLLSWTDFKYHFF